MRKIHRVLAVIAFFTVIIASVATVFYCLPSTREILLTPQLTKKEWKQMEHYAYKVATESIYQSSTFKLPEYDEKPEDIEVVELKTSEDILSVEVRKENYYVVASFRPYENQAEGQNTTAYDYNKVSYSRYQKNIKESIIIDYSSNWKRIRLWVKNIAIAVIVGTMIGSALPVFLWIAIIVIADFGKKSSFFLKKIFDYFLEKGKRLNRKFIMWLKERGEV